MADYFKVLYCHPSELQRSRFLDSTPDMLILPAVKPTCPAWRVTARTAQTSPSLCLCQGPAQGAMYFSL